MHEQKPPDNAFKLYALILLFSLTSCGDGSSSTSVPAPIPVALPAPPPAPQGLLSDDQLTTTDDPQAALADSDAATWFSQNAKTIRSLTEDTVFSDLSFFDTLLQNKRLVMLGESSHGVEEYSRAKVRLIKYLHEQQGFNVLAFEGGLFDCENAQELLQTSTPRAAATSCLFGVWQTQTLIDLFIYLQATQSTSNPLRVTGFDVQPSGTAFTQRAKNTSDLVAKVSPEFSLVVLNQERDFHELTTNARLATDVNSDGIAALRSQLPFITAGYNVLANYLLSNLTAITTDGEFSERDVLIAVQYARTSPDYAEQQTQRFEQGGGGRARDRGMAKNLIALSNELYPNERIIGWAHNAHLRHQGTGFLPNANMGALAHAELERDMYTIGFYMYRGQHAFNDRSIVDVSPPLNYSLESIFFKSRLAYLFLDIENASTEETGSGWLNQPTPTWAWGSSQVTLNLSQEYDGVFIIDTASPPDYL